MGQNRTISDHWQLKNCAKNWKGLQILVAAYKYRIIEEKFEEKSSSFLELFIWTKEQSIGIHGINKVYKLIDPEARFLAERLSTLNNVVENASEMH